MQSGCCRVHRCVFASPIVQESERGVAVEIFIIVWAVVIAVTTFGVASSRR